MKRFLSILLAVMLVTAMFPVASADDTVDTTVTEPETFEYVTTFDAFKTSDMYWTATEPAGGWGANEVVRISGKGLIQNKFLLRSDATVSIDKNGNACEPFKIMDLTKTDPWGWEMDYSTGGTRLGGTEYLHQTFSGTSFGSFSSGSYLMLRLNVPAKGKYMLSLDGAKYAGRINAAIYFFSAEGYTVDYTVEAKNRHKQCYAFFSGRTPVGYYDFADTTTTGYGDVGVVEVPTEGDYYIVFFGDSKSLESNPTKANQEMRLKGIKLTPVDELSSVSVTATPATAEVGSEIAVKTTATYTISGEKEITEGVSYVSENTSVATVSGTTVTAVGLGETKITATYEGKSADVVVTVIPPVPSTAATCEYVTTFDILNSANMRVTDSGYNTTDVLRNAYGAALFNRSKMGYNATFALDKSGNPCTPYNVFKKWMTNDWEWASGYANTQAISKDHNALYSQFKVDGYGNYSSGFYLMLRVNVPHKGKYVLSYDGNRKTNAAAPGIFFAKDDGSTLSTDKNKDQPKFINGQFVGHANFADTTKTGYVDVGTVEVPTAGDYYIGFACTAQSKELSPPSGDYQFMELKGIKLTPIPEDEELKGAFDYTEDDFASAPLTTATVNTFTAKLGESKKGEDAADVKSTTVTLGEICTVEAPAAEEGYKFLYWAKGLSTDKKQIVSYNESYSFIPTVENTYLIAVYEAVNGENEVNKAEFYNANGQLIETLTADGKAPALPEMAGYNAATGWALYGSDEVIAVGADVEVSGMKVYVAKFGNPKTVQVNGKDVAYGEKVSFTAAPPKNEVFKAWKKDGVIVSTSETYEFYAWKDSTTVEAVYVTEDFTFTGKAMKILLDSFSAGDKTALMAEFIGFEDAVEKGIMLGTKRFAMTTNASQFTIVNDTTETEVTGYAIFKDGTIVYDN
ncbi:MAG: hypothetical protein E7473_10445 [Ruminococcaceae bacterium]|nr:hypothetical protein [Oscillospiraceae bacterium]